ncbi:hypothetical protein AERO9AM_10249 [Aeromicrobium sp. 9AM]|nr:hypothetical protein AERO9AM_10249 [Aeromicrobium sp. 9AM]
MAYVAIKVPGRTLEGSIAEVSKLTFSAESHSAWEKAMSAIEQAERHVDEDSQLICIH